MEGGGAFYFARTRSGIIIPARFYRRRRDALKDAFAARNRWLGSRVVVRLKVTSLTAPPFRLRPAQ